MTDVYNEVSFQGKLSRLEAEAILSHATECVAVAVLLLSTPAGSTVLCARIR